jgi:hypothetical protein
LDARNCTILQRRTLTSAYLHFIPRGQFTAHDLVTNNSVGNFFKSFTHIAPIIVITKSRNNKKKTATRAIGPKPLATMDDLTPSPTCPLMSASKQNRILIWRNEVATASVSCTATSNYSAPSLVTTTTASSTSLSPSELATLSRSSRLWHKVKTQFSGRARRRSSAANADVPDFMMPPKKGDVTRTAMYQTLRPGMPMPEISDEEVVPGRGSSNGHGHSLWKRQKRLLRAAMLVNQMNA